MVRSQDGVRVNAYDLPLQEVEIELPPVERQPWMTYLLSTMIPWVSYVTLPCFLQLPRWLDSTAAGMLALIAWVMVRNLWLVPRHTMWDRLVLAHAPAIKQVEKSTCDFLGARRFNLLTSLIGIGIRLVPLRWCDEVIVMSQQTGVSVGCLGFMQFVYEWAAGCTSIVLTDQEGSGRLLHLRTMDWRMPFDLSPLTVQVRFLRNGEVVYRATTWAGYTGVLTGMVPRRTSGGYSVAINFRGQAAVGAGSANRIGQLVYSLVSGGALVGQLVRSVLETGDQHLDQAITRFETSPLLAPCYITLVGANPHQAVVLTRGRLDCEARSGHRLIQTNMDDPTLLAQQGRRVVDVMNSLTRIRAGREIVKEGDGLVETMEGGGEGWIKVWELLGDKRITHGSTIYGSVMCAYHGWYSTRVNREYCGKLGGTLAELQQRAAEARRKAEATRSA
eukprot:TRINITY_DN4945_c0_g1_i2.p1 TRINITY_DN4945_c0_g1~~TRINITY_DN4945_c0_g1_i2.p1  ORF type:complete len:446 (+),score=79.55 TRINITY_DN4945_c0_g1_i2:253-1590(+)